MRCNVDKGKSRPGNNYFLVVICIYIAFIIFFPLQVSAQTASFLFQPGLVVPTGPEYSEIEDTVYSSGMKFSLRGQLIPRQKTSFFIEGFTDITMLPLSGSGGDNMNLYALGVGPGYTLKPGGRFSFQAMLAGGGYVGSLGSSSSSNLFGKMLVGGSYSLSDSIDLNLNADYNYYLTSSNTNFNNTFNGFGISMGLSYHPSGNSDPVRLELPVKRLPPLYPVMHAAYDTIPLGSVTLLNKESGPINDVKVYYYLSRYMDAPKLSAVIPNMEKGEEVETDLHALLDKDILNETEGTAANAEITVDYNFRGINKTYRENIRADILYRNALKWDDDRKVASFVTARDPAILTLARNSQNIIRQHPNQSVDKALRQGLAIYEMLRIFEFSYVIDPESSYKDLSSNGAMDFLQFPFETLLYQAGDCDDLSVLYVSLLEALSVETAFITIPGHIFAAFALETSTSESRSVFPRSQSELIYRDGKVWLPVEVTLLGSKDFLEAWRVGASQWKEYNDKGKAGFWPVRKAWEVYKPVGLIASMDNLASTNMDRLNSVYDRTVTAYIEKEIRYKVMELREEIASSTGLVRTKRINSLGVLFARNGLYTDAIGTLKTIVDGRNPYTPAQLNMANIYYLINKVDEAAELYRRVADVMPNSAPAYLGLALVENQRGNIAAKEEAYTEFLALAPEKAKKYAYLAEPTTTSQRASSRDEKGMPIWEAAE